ncbi:hypothetical protein QBC35DRAFT_164998 [Podospora australis]|uniref:Ubiquitin 3 binding protein But2 C-terminal domain-containing protein n=1 Tax=Podospora australis TaxID=1536484 RepID=A0AAN6X3D8_9PEZI|nr:hypothetical protein QBC35DRAFT_164998 [Podospora australis]
MQFTTLLLTLAATLQATTALPTTASTCQRVRSPASMLNIANAQPRIPSYFSTQTITFTIPATARGACALIADFPANYTIVDYNVQHGSTQGPIKINVIDVNGPAPNSIVGTVGFPSAMPGQKTKTAAKLTINSFACREKMTFRFESTGGDRSIQYYTGEVGFEQTDKVGLFVEHSC